MFHYIPVMKTIAAITLAEVRIQEIARFHGPLESTITDRGSLSTLAFYSS